MSGHTRGPWRVRTFDGSSWSVDAAGDLMIAQAQQLRPLSIDPKQLERHANALLIAAAPELLEALIDLEMGVDLPSDSPALAELRAKALAAIAKATQP